MEYYIAENPDELYHYGVKGMRWGHRKAPEYTNAQKVGRKMSTMKAQKTRYKNAKAAYRADHKNYKDASKKASSAFYAWRKDGDRHIQDAWKYDDMQKQSRQNMRDAKKSYKDAKKEYKAEVNKTNENYTKGARTIDKVLYNGATQKRVNKIMNKTQGMSMEEARKQVHREAWDNTIQLVTLAGGMAFVNKLM